MSIAKCVIPNCDKEKIYNYKNEKSRAYCKIHKLPDMVNFKYNECNDTDCDNKPSYNYIGESIPSYCSIHKTDEMIDFDKLRLNAKCHCDKPGHKYFNFRKPFWLCKECHNNMYGTDKICNHPECPKMCGFAFDGEKYPLLCTKHKLPDMIDFKSKRCLEPGCDKKSSIKHYKGYCSGCFHIKYPDISYDRNNKTKERIIVNNIIKQFPDFKFILDKAIGPLNHRPDMLLDLDDKVIIVEIDEYQHKGYNTNELLRLDTIQKAINKKIICIRFNPDSFIKDNIRTSSCFKLNNNKIFEVSKPDEFDNRLKHLYKYIKKYASNNYILKKHNVKTRKLYFDS